MPTVPSTRVEKVDEPGHGEVPGTNAYAMRGNDVKPDQVAVVIPEGNWHKGGEPRSPTPGGHPIPTTSIGKVDPSGLSHGEVPGTLAHETHAADAVPDLVVKTGGRRRSSSIRSKAGSTLGNLPIPITKVEKLDSEPSHREIPGTKAFELRKEDSEPDVMEEGGDIPGKDLRSH